MKTLIRLPGLYPQDIGTAAYQELCQTYPEGCQTNEFNVSAFRCVLSEDDPRAHLILDCLERHGFTPSRPFGKRKPNEYVMSIERIYEKQDLDCATYLVPKPQALYNESYERSEAGLIELTPYQLSLKEDIAFVLFQWIIVSNRLKRYLEQKSLKHVIFRPTQVVGQDKARFEGQFWELTTDYTLPRLSPTCHLVNESGEPFTEGKDRLRFYFEGPLVYPELHYRASALGTVEPFDLARTHERFGGDEEGSLVASNQFYKLCEEQKLPIKWIPVRIDPN